MANNQESYDQAYLAQGGGDFITVTNFNISTTVNAKVKHTLRRTAAGVVLGRAEVSVSFDLIVGATGPERAFHNQMLRGEEIQLRAKIPGGEVLIMNGKYGNIIVDCLLDDAVKYSVGFMGGVERPLAA